MFLRDKDERDTKIKRLLSLGVPQKDIAEFFNLDPTSISKLKAGKLRKGTPRAGKDKKRGPRLRSRAINRPKLHKIESLVPLKLKHALKNEARRREVTVSKLIGRILDETLRALNRR